VSAPKSRRIEDGKQYRLELEEMSVTSFDLREVSWLASGHFNVHYSNAVGTGVVGQGSPEDVFSDSGGGTGIWLFGRGGDSVWFVGGG
jgi:hypothetical protein